MHCRSAQNLIFAERDGALSSGERAGLQAHVSGCGECRRMRDQLGAALTQWQNEARAVAVPDSERAWQDIRRAVRVDREAKRRRAYLPWVLPLGAAAGLAVFALTNLDSPPLPDSIPVAHETGSGVEYVDVPADAASMVFVDDETGWVVVWSTPSAEELPPAP